MLAVDFVHFPNIEEDETDEDVDRALLGKPKPELESTDSVLVQLIHEKDAASEGNDEPEDEETAHQFQIGAPICICGIFRAIH